MHLCTKRGFMRGKTLMPQDGILLAGDEAPLKVGAERLRGVPSPAGRATCGGDEQPDGHGGRYSPGGRARASPYANVVGIFSPEHGFEVPAGAGEHVSSSVDEENRNTHLVALRKRGWQTLRSADGGVRRARRPAGRGASLLHLLRQHGTANGRVRRARQTDGRTGPPQPQRILRGRSPTRHET